MKYYSDLEENSTKCATIDDPGGHYAKCDKLVTEK